MASDSGFQFTFQYVYAKETLALGAALPAVCIIVVALRFVAKKVQRVGLTADDWCALAALFPTVGLGACLIAGAALKVMGYPTPAPPSDLTEEELDYYVAPSTIENQIIEYPFQILLMLAYCFIKLSIVLFYRRIFVTHRGSAIDIFLLAICVVIVLWAFSFEMLIVFACGKHFWANWGSTGAQLEYCPVAFTSEYGLAISDLILDGIIFIIPIPLVWRLQMTTKRKLAIIGIFLLGASAVGASIARLILYVQVLKAITAEAAVDTNRAFPTSPPTASSSLTDTVLLTVSYYWSTLEAGLALIAACLPPLSYLFTHTSEFKILHSGISLQSLRNLRQSHKTQSQKSQGSYDDRSGSVQEPKMPVVIGRTVSVDVEHGVVRKDDGSAPVNIHGYREAWN